MRVRVHVFLKSGVLDVQGKAVENALRGLGWSYPIIAQLCERDHSSVHYAVQKWAEHLTKQATGE